MHPSFSAPSKVDLVFYDPKEEEYVVVIVHSGNWDGSDEEEDSLKEKLTSYAQFLLGDQFKRLYPDSRQVRIQIDGPSVPPTKTIEVINQARNRLLAHNIRIDFALV